MVALSGVLGCAGAVFAGAVGVVSGVAALGFAAETAGVAGVVVGAEFEDELGGAVFAELGAPDAAAVAGADTGVLGEVCDDATFVAGAELEFEVAAVGAEAAGVADPAGVFAEFVAAGAFEFASGAGAACVAAGAGVVGFRARFRKGSP